MSVLDGLVVLLSPSKESITNLTPIFYHTDIKLTKLYLWKSKIVDIKH